MADHRCGRVLSAVAAAAPFLGGNNRIGVQPGPEAACLVFWGSPWGTVWPAGPQRQGKADRSTMTAADVPAMRRILWQRVWRMRIPS
jgi:hypothetical protein